MQIKTRLQIITILSIGVALAVGLILFLTNRQMIRASEVCLTSDLVVKDMAELEIVTHDYLLHHEDRAKKQWLSKHESLSKLLKTVKFISPEKKGILENVRHEHESIKSIFNQLATIREKMQTLDQKAMDISEELKARLTSRLLLRLQTVILGAFRLSQARHADMVTAQQRNGLLIIVFVVIITGVISLILLLIRRSFVNPIAQLHEGTRIIGTGNLDYKVGTTSEDEIGQLSRAFDQMTNDLKKTTASIFDLNREIDERKKTEEALKESGERFHKLFDNMSSGVAVYEAKDNGNDFIFKDFNTAAERIENIKKEDLIGKSVLDVFPGVKEFGLFDVFKRVWETGEPKHHPITLYKDERVEGWRKNYVYKLPSGEIVAAYDDITESKQAEESLRKSEEHYRLLVENANDAIFIAQDEIIKFANSRTEQMMGYSVEELAKISFTKILHPGDRDMVIDSYKRKLKGEKLPSTYDFRIINRSGEESWVQINVAPITWEGRPAILNFLRDITQQKRLEAQLIQSQKMEAIGILTGGIAHDFNNILTTIIGRAHLALIQVDKDNPLREEIEEIKIAGERAASLTRQLLTFSRKQTIRPEIMDLNEVLLDLEKMLGRLIGEDVEFKMVRQPALWRVKMDPGQVEQTVMNLVVNARDAMPMGGKLTVETANVDLDEVYFRKHGVETKPGPYVMLATSDTGIGMDEETQLRIFEPFFTTKEVGKGTGLGLSTVYGIVKQNNGFIWVYSEPGHGSTFKVYLPKVKEGMEPEEKERISVENLGGSETVLIVEDDDSLRKITRTVLDQRGYKVLEAENGEDALRVSEAHDGSIDLLITDVVMPKMGGKETAEWLQPLYPHMKVIYMSGYTDDAIVHHGVLAPGMNFLEKPFAPEGLARKVREILNTE